MIVLVYESRFAGEPFNHIFLSYDETVRQIAPASCFGYSQVDEGGYVGSRIS